MMSQENDNRPEDGLPKWPEDARDDAESAPSQTGHWWIPAMRWGAVGGLLVGGLPVLYLSLTMGRGHSTGGVSELFYPMVFGIGGVVGFIIGFIVRALFGRRT